MPQRHLLKQKDTQRELSRNKLSPFDRQLLEKAIGKEVIAMLYCMNLHHRDYMFEQVLLLFRLVGEIGVPGGYF